MKTHQNAAVIAAGVALATLLGATPASAKITAPDRDGKPTALYEEGDLSSYLSFLNIPDRISSGHLPAYDSVNDREVSTADATNAVSIAQVSQYIRDKFADTGSIDIRVNPGEVPLGGGMSVNASGRSTKTKVAFMSGPHWGKTDYGFVGKLEEKYPRVATTDGVGSLMNLTYTVSSTTTNTTAHTTGWTLGGKVSANASGKDGTPGVGGEFNFSYTDTTTTTDTQSGTISQAMDLRVPDRATGWLEARFNGGVYVGWVVATTGDHRYSLYPARVSYKTPDRDVARNVTWVPRGRTTPIF
ncbi:hypothetical protein ACIQ6V_27690 [Streptomyces sp. NPDC096198]|uniref:hypothetical protein n=1 Tax=Streptomyces sp. NPDC096198 TaxID=3366080 RepID=UPI00380B8FAF